MGRKAHALATFRIDFHGHQLLAFKDARGTFVALKPIAAAIGLSWTAQIQRLLRDQLLRSGRTLAVLPTDGGPQPCTCLRLDLVHGWLFTIQAARLSAPTLAKVRLFQRDCYAALVRALDDQSSAPMSLARVGQPSLPAVLAFAQREMLAAAHP